MAKKKKKKAAKRTKKAAPKKRGYGRFGKASGPNASVMYQALSPKTPRHKLNIGAVKLDNYHFMVVEADKMGISIRELVDRVVDKAREEGSFGV